MVNHPNGERHATVEDLREYPEIGGKRAKQLFYVRPHRKEVENDEFVVDNIKAHRFNKRANRLEFRVRWKGFGARDDTWEPLRRFFPMVQSDAQKYLKEKFSEIRISDLVSPVMDGNLEPATQST